jgi:hypothetical protein
MTHRLGALSLGLLALFIASGLTASNAAAGVLTTSSYPAALTSETGKESVFAFTGSGNFVRYSCLRMQMSSGTFVEPVSTFSLHPVLTECSDGKVATPIPTTGCDFRFHIGETTGESGNYAGTVDLLCEAGKSLAFPPIGSCEVRVDPQEEFGSVEFINMAGSPSDFTINWIVEGFQYTVLKDGFGCPFPGTGTREDGDFTTPPTTVVSTNGSGLKIEM